jgi:pantoate--beta-alanine ligase
MVSDLNMPLEIVVCPTVREASGLAVSSRNKYLGEHEREEAALIYESLRKCREMVESGVDEVKAIIEAMREVLGRSPAIKIEYVEIVDAESLERLERVRGRVLAAEAVRLGGARLIDNIVVDVGRE